MPERIPFHVQIDRIIELLAKQIYQSPLALLRENCQNAYDAVLQRIHLGQSFDPQISITVTPGEVRVVDNGIGMTRNDLVQHYWRAGASGKNNSEARAAGVVGTFGIGAMANFGVASKLTVTTESASVAERTTSFVTRERLSAIEDCIEIVAEEPHGQPGTTVIVEVSQASPISVNSALAHIKECVRFLRVPVHFNGQLLSGEQFEASVPSPPTELHVEKAAVAIAPQMKADIRLVFGKTGEVWAGLTNVSLSDKPLDGTIILRQGQHQIRTFRSRFSLATAAASSFYGLGGVANLAIFEPTAGREALTTASLQVLQGIVTSTEQLISEEIARTHLSNMNTNFMEWAVQHGRFELCSKLLVKLEPGDQSMRLEEIASLSMKQSLNCLENPEPSLIRYYASEDKPLLVISASQPRRKCELTYLQRFCRINQISNRPTLLHVKAERDLSLPESAVAFRIVNILESDYFLRAEVMFGKISHNLPLLVDVSKTPVEIVIDGEGSTVSTMLRLYETDLPSMTGIIKDFVRSAIFPKVADLVPSSTRAGAEAFLRAIRRPRDVFEYEKSDLGSLSEIWQDYIEGKISLADAARQSVTVTRATVQIVDRSATTSAADVIPDVIQSQKILDQTEQSSDGVPYQAAPAITRLDKEASVKLLTIEDNETSLKGYRCFLAITERAREDRGEFFLQPHRTEIVWGGQKALYVFQHHSGRFGVYYELQSTEVLSDTSGGGAFETCTIVLRNQIYIPVPDRIREKFIPQGAEKKRFEIRCELLYTESDNLEASARL